VLTSTIFSCLINAMCFCGPRALVKPSAGMSVVEIQLILTVPLAVSCRSQCWCISMCLSFVTSFGDSFIMSRTVCKLSQLTVVSESRSSDRFSKTRRHQNSYAQMWESASSSSSASVEEVVTVRCRVLCQSRQPPNSLNKPPSVL
jgi:hypothetical protein